MCVDTLTIFLVEVFRLRISLVNGMWREVLNLQKCLSTTGAQTRY